MIWIPFTAAGIINGIGHYWGYRNFDAPDASSNIVPWGILIGGEELHNNHHTYPTSAKLSVKWYEFDIGWLYIRVLQALGLAKVLRVAPAPEVSIAEARRSTSRRCRRSSPIATTCWPSTRAISRHAYRAELGSLRGRRRPSGRVSQVCKRLAAQRR